MTSTSSIDYCTLNNYAIEKIVESAIQGLVPRFAQFKIYLTVVDMHRLSSSCNGWIYCMWYCYPYF